MTTLSPHSRVDTFHPLDGSTHLLVRYDWGPGVACSTRFVSGETGSTVVSAISCEDCVGALSTGTFEVRKPDKRYATGFRVERNFDNEALAQTWVDTFGEGREVHPLSMTEAIEREQEATS